LLFLYTVSKIIKIRVYLDIDMSDEKKKTFVSKIALVTPNFSYPIREVV